LRKVGITGDDQRPFHSEGPVRRIAGVVANRSVPSLDHGSHAPISKAEAPVFLILQVGIESQSCNRSYQFEGRTWWILTITCAIKQFLWCSCGAGSDG